MLISNPQPDNNLINNLIFSYLKLSFIYYYNNLTKFLSYITHRYAF